MSKGLQKIREWFRREANAVEEVVEGETPVATPPPGAAWAGTGDTDRETSTNAQVEGAADQPWPGSG
jgi:hypothetical protein